MIQAIYIISIGGVPIYYYDVESLHKDKVKEATLFSGVISAIQTAMAEISAGKPRYFTTESAEVFLEAAEDFGLALVSSSEKKTDQEIVSEIMRRMITKLSFELASLPESSILTEEQTKKIDNIIDESLEDLSDRIKESKATKKLKDALW